MILQAQALILAEAWKDKEAGDILDLFEKAELSVKNEISRQLGINGFPGRYLTTINKYIGGSEYCQCSGCAESINNIEYVSASTMKRFRGESVASMIEDSVGVFVEITFNTDDAQRCLAENY